MVVKERKEAKKEAMKAVILAGGFGTRLRPLTFTKPMVPLVNKPVIEHVVDYLVSYGLNDIVVTTTFLREAIMDHFRYKRRRAPDISNRAISAWNCGVR